MIKTVSLVASAAVISAAVTFIPLLSPAADARTIAPVVSVSAVSAPVLPVAPVVVAAEPDTCKEQTWPYIETSCLKGAAPGQQAVIRTVSAVRTPAGVR